MSEPTSHPPAPPDADTTPDPHARPEPRNAVERWLRRFENPTVSDLLIVVGLIPVIALLAVVIFAWLLSG